MKKSKTPHDVPTYGPNDHLGHAANAKHEADWCVRNGDLDRAWGLYHEQQNRYLLHTTKRGSAFTPEATAALISSVNESFANILRLEAKHRQALSHMIYCVAGATKPTKGQLKKLPSYFKRSKFSKATFRDVERLVSHQRKRADLQEIIARLAEWEHGRMSHAA